MSVLNWGAFQTCFISFIVSIAAALLVFTQRTTRFTEPSKVGLALSYSFLLPYFLQVLAMVMSVFGSGLTSLERILQYRGPAVPQEPTWVLGTDPSLMAGGDVAEGREAGGGKAGEREAGRRMVTKMARTSSRVAGGSRAAWPSAGEIVFDRVSLQYRRGLPFSLYDVSLHIRGGAKVGVVGRTGAGKSSIVSVRY